MHIYNDNIVIDSIEQFNKECDLPIFRIYFVSIINGFLKIINLIENTKDVDQVIKDALNTLNNISGNYLLISALSSNYTLEYWCNYLKENNVDYKFEYDKRGAINIWI